MVGIYQRSRESAVSILWARNATEDWGRTSVHFYQTIWRHIPDDNILRLCVSILFSEVWRLQISLWIYKYKMDKIQLHTTPSLWSSHTSTEFHFAGREASSLSPRSVSQSALWRDLWRYILSWHYCNPDRRIKSNKDVCTADTCRTLAFYRSRTVEPLTLATLSSPQWTSLGI